MLWKDKMVSEGIIAGHDYRPAKFPGVVKAVQEMLGKPDKIFPDYSWVKVMK